MNMQHTPGPWRHALKSEGTWHVGVYDSNGTEVAHIAVKTALTAQRRDADACLIAAAPDMLGALHMVRMLRQLGGMLPGSREIVQSIVDAADEAIAKATGSAS